MFGAGGGTSSYREAEDADLLLGIHVGTDISLANAIGREIIEAGLVNETFVARATTGFDAYAATVQPYTLDRASRDTGVPADLIRQLAHEYARADRAQICWTLGITEHHNATDNVFALINLALLTGHVGRDGSGLVPLRGQNNVQGGGDMGAIPSKLTGFQDGQADMEARARFEAAYGTPIPPKAGWHLSLMFEAMERGELTIVIWRGRHVNEPTELYDIEAPGYWAEVLNGARALTSVYKPLKMNYETLGNSLPNLHTHLIPWFTDDPR